MKTFPFAKLVHSYSPVYGIQAKGEQFELFSIVLSLYSDGTKKEFVNSCGVFLSFEEADRARTMILTR